MWAKNNHFSHLIYYFSFPKYCVDKICSILLFAFPRYNAWPHFSPDSRSRDVCFWLIISTINVNNKIPCNELSCRVLWQLFKCLELDLKHFVAGGCNCSKVRIKSFHSVEGNFTYQKTSLFCGPLIVVMDMNCTGTSLWVFILHTHLSSCCWSVAACETKPPLIYHLHENYPYLLIYCSIFRIPNYSW